MKEKRITRQWIEVEPHTYSGSLTDYGWEDAARRLTELLAEHDAFKRDRVELMKEEEDICSFCHCEWETDPDGCPVCCEKAQKEYEAEEERKRRAISVVGSL
jgi:hypothetical protein